MLRTLALLLLVFCLFGRCKPLCNTIALGTPRWALNAMAGGSPGARCSPCTASVFAGRCYGVVSGQAPFQTSTHFYMPCPCGQSATNPDCQPVAPGSASCAYPLTDWQFVDALQVTDPDPDGNGSPSACYVHYDTHDKVDCVAVEFEI